MGLLGAETAACSLTECDRPPRDLVTPRVESRGGYRGTVRACRYVWELTLACNIVKKVIHLTLFTGY